MALHAFAWICIYSTSQPSKEPAPSKAGLYFCMGMDAFAYIQVKSVPSPQKSMAVGGADAFTLCSTFGWSDIRMALRYTHAMNDAKRQAVENMTGKKNSGGKKVTKGKRQARQPAVSG